MSRTAVLQRCAGGWLAAVAGLAILVAACGEERDDGNGTRAVVQALQWEIRVPVHWDLWMAAPPHLWDGVTELPADFLDRQIQLAGRDDSTIFFLALLHDPGGVDLEAEAEAQMREQARGGPSAHMDIEGPLEISREPRRWTAEFRASGVPPPGHPSEDAAGNEEWAYRFVVVQSPDRPHEAWMLMCGTGTSDARAECDAAIDSFAPWEWPVIP